MTPHQLYSQNKALAKWTVQRYRMPSLARRVMDLEDLYQIADVALWEACTTYNPDAPYKFSTYAVNRIRFTITHMLRHYTWPKRGHGYKTISTSIPLNSHTTHQPITFEDAIAVDDMDFSQLWVQEFIETLEPHHRRIIELRMQELTDEQIGQILGVRRQQVAKYRKQIQKRYLEHTA